MSLLKKIGPWIVSAALCLLAVEVLGAALFHRKTASFVYFNQPKTVAAQPAVAEVGYKRRLHPYFGYTGPYSERTATVSITNNLGFIDHQERELQREVPFKPDANDYIVFVFGGSVSSRLANHSMHGTTLPQALKRLPQLAGRNIIIYNMAQGPGKQPQQVIELAYLIAAGQHIDLVLNLDGAPEFVAGLNNLDVGIDPIFPSVDILLAIGNELTLPDTSSAAYYELAYAVSNARAEGERYERQSMNSVSGIGYIKNQFFKAIYDRSLDSNLTAYNQMIARTAGWEAARKRLGLDMPIRTSKERVVEDIFDMWIRSSDLMKVMSNSIGATYLNIVLPNPYYSKKTFTEAEKKLMVFPASHYVHRGSAAGLAFIESRAEMLKSRGIVSAVGLFDDVSDTVYVDSVGHLGKLGESMLADFVADQAGLRLSRQAERK